MSRQNKSIQQKKQELNEILGWFESDEFELELAMEKFETAEKLVSEIESELKEYKNKFTVLEKRFDQTS
jgi:exonuclease VII small subunit